MRLRQRAGFCFVATIVYHLVRDRKVSHLSEFLVENVDGHPEFTAALRHQRSLA
jgi:hypothetical protein